MIAWPPWLPVPQGFVAAVITSGPNVGMTIAEAFLRGRFVDPRDPSRLLTDADR